MAFVLLLQTLVDLNNHFSWQKFIPIVTCGTNVSEDRLLRSRKKKTSIGLCSFVLLLLPALYILDCLRLIRRKMDYSVASCVNLTVQQRCL